MAADTRRFTSTLLLLFGPLFMVGGYLAAFTVEGAIYVFIGVGMVATGILLRTRLPLLVAMGAGILLCLAFTARMIGDLPQ
jgi:hypothetical protein